MAPPPSSNPRSRNSRSDRDPFNHFVLEHRSENENIWQDDTKREELWWDLIEHCPRADIIPVDATPTTVRRLVSNMIQRHHAAGISTSSGMQLFASDGWATICPDYLHKLGLLSRAEASNRLLAASAVRALGNSSTRQADQDSFLETSPAEFDIARTSAGRDTGYFVRRDTFTPADRTSHDAISQHTPEPLSVAQGHEDPGRATASNEASPICIPRGSWRAASATLEASGQQHRDSESLLSACTFDEAMDSIDDTVLTDDASKTHDQSIPDYPNPDRDVGVSSSRPSVRPHNTGQGMRSPSVPCGSPNRKPSDGGTTSAVERRQSTTIVGFKPTRSSSNADYLRNESPAAAQDITRSREKRVATPPSPSTPPRESRRRLTFNPAKIHPSQYNRLSESPPQTVAVKTEEESVTLGRGSESVIPADRAGGPSQPLPAARNRTSSTTSRQTEAITEDHHYAMLELKLQENLLRQQILQCRLASTDVGDR